MYKFLALFALVACASVDRDLPDGEPPVITDPTDTGNDPAEPTKPEDPTKPPEEPTDCTWDDTCECIYNEDCGEGQKCNDHRCYDTCRCDDDCSGPDNNSCDHGLCKGHN
jgi:hypothetical protein